MSDLLEYLSTRTRWEGDCLVFTNNCKSSKGYAIAPLDRFKKEYNTKYLHRMIYMYHKEVKLTTDECILHACDNPPCINIMHLSVGSKADNNRDRDQKGRQAKRLGEDNPRARLTIDKVRFIRRTDGIFSGSLVAKVLDVHRDTISAVRRRKNWGHIQ